MKATIDIKTPAGQSLEEFPQTCDISSYIALECWPNKNDVVLRMERRYSGANTITNLHKGDTITIRIEED